VEKMVELSNSLKKNIIQIQSNRSMDAEVIKRPKIVTEKSNDSTDELKLSSINEEPAFMKEVKRLDKEIGNLRLEMKTMFKKQEEKFDKKLNDMFHLLMEEIKKLKK
jgi:predicted RNA-binding protein